MIFQTELTNLDAELSQLQAALDTKRQQRQQFEELDAETTALFNRMRYTFKGKLRSNR
jgi:cell division protein FtsB